MKLATYKDGSRDGQLVVVSRDLSLAHFATGIATRLQQLLDDWNFISPRLEDLYATLNGGKARHAFPFDPRLAMAPLPRAFLRVEGTGAGPGLRLAASDAALGPTDDAAFAGANGPMALGAGLAVVTGDIDRGTGAAAALEGVRLLLLDSAWTPQRPAEPDAEADVEAQAPGRPGDGLQARPATAYAPVAATPDELGEAWQRGKVHLSLGIRRGGHPAERIEAAPAMRAHFGQLIAEAARARPVRAGSIVASGALHTAGVSAGEIVRIELKALDGGSVFGAIEQRLVVAPDGD